MKAERHLAAAVICKAIEDYTIYHSPKGVDFRERDRKAKAFGFGGKVKFGVKQAKCWEDRCMQDCVDMGDPGDFLSSQTVFHDLLGISGLDLMRVIEERGPDQIMRMIRSFRSVRSNINRKRQTDPLM